MIQRDSVLGILEMTQPALTMVDSRWLLNFEIHQLIWVFPKIGVPPHHPF